MNYKHFLRLFLIAVLSLLLIGEWSRQKKQEVRAAPARTTTCEPLGWFPDEFGLKDHTVFWHDGAYYLASIYLSDDDNEGRFAYARSTDLCTWEYLGGLLDTRPLDGWDSFRIWAPFVLAEAGTYYMYYTGVTADFTQSIMLATSNDPGDLASWQREEMLFQPAHAGMNWVGAGQWSDCRDPVVYHWGELYYLYYTGSDQDGGIVGLATATSPEGPWQDWGSILTVSQTMLESPVVIAHESWYYLLYNRTDGTGEELRVGPTPAGPWSSPRAFHPGWAHEIWQTPGGVEMTSYLTTYQVTIRPFNWDTVFAPPWPFIGEQVFHVWMPLILRRE